ncbi:hypothetical protein [Leptolyngbya sp. FACHB-711]|uniref:hypothetical protein n=1 Tax=Leptolyngbya sp. FACHB-711 TaxID=2692813 RepID=UPI00168671BC|nr:hypothetical protein [Leptolyngbya sp. FACHB-711]MBD2025260.1 hypothetical protein [Leptolyngbya sp. FACHB-711]
MPTLAILKRRSIEESWADQRKAFRYQTATKNKRSSWHLELLVKDFDRNAYTLTRAFLNRPIDVDYLTASVEEL